MKIGEPCYAVVRETTGVIYDTYSREEYALVGVGECERHKMKSHVAPVTLLPTSEVARLRACEATLHRNRMHPDYEYQTCVFTPGQPDNMIKPDGDGWEPNNHRFGNGTNLHINTTTEFRDWMRLKSPPTGDGEK